MNGEAGKGDLYRKVDFRKYDYNWLRLYGVKCSKCHGSGRVQTSHEAITGPCTTCDGFGYVEKKKRR